MPKNVLTPEERAIQQIGMYTPEMIDELDDEHELERYKNVIISMLKPGDGGPSLGWLAQFLVGMVVHTGKAGLMTKTAGVAVDPNTLQYHLVLNPFLAQGLQDVDVQRGLIPIDPALQAGLVSANYRVSSFDDPPAHIRRLMRERGHAPRGENEWVGVRIDNRRLISVLEHELGHILHQHVQQAHDRNQFPDAQVANLAFDVAINQHVKNLPEWAVTLESYKNDPHYPIDLPKEESADTYYRLLAEYYKDAKRGSKPPDKTKSAVQGLPADTMIEVPGGQVPIQQIRRMQRVLTRKNDGSVVERFVLHVKAEDIAVQDTIERLATNLYSMKTTQHELTSVGGKVKVWVEGRGWVGVGQVTGLVPPPVTTPIHTAKPTPAPRPKPAPPLTVGENIAVLGANQTTVLLDKVTLINTERRQKKKLHQLAVQAVDGPSSFFANGILVKGLDIPTGEKPKKDGDGDGGLPPPPPFPPLDDDDVINPGGGQGQGQEEGQPGPGGEGEPGPGGGQGGFPGPKGPGGKPGPKQPGEGQPEEGQPGPERDDKEEQEGESGSEPDISLPSTVDDHSMWTTKLPKQLQREALRRFTKNADARIKKSNAYGDTPAHIRTLIEKITAPPTIDWRRELQAWVGGCIKKDVRRTRKKPSRRYISSGRGWLVPGEKATYGAILWLAVDNSGSISPHEAEQFAAEIIEMLKQGHEAVLIVWDTAIVQVQRLRRESDVHEAFKDLGGGGGSTAAPLIFEALEHRELLTGEAAQLMAKEPTGIIFLTDGDILWPAKTQDPGIPVLWGITRENNVNKQPFGDSLYVHVEGVK